MSLRNLLQKLIASFAPPNLSAKNRVRIKVERTATKENTVPAPVQTTKDNTPITDKAVKLPDGSLGLFKGPSHDPVTNLRETISSRAYELWEAAERPEGDGVEFWLRAEAELTKMNKDGHYQVYLCDLNRSGNTGFYHNWEPAIITPTGEVVPTKKKRRATAST